LHNTPVYQDMLAVLAMVMTHYRSCVAMQPGRQNTSVFIEATPQSFEPIKNRVKWWLPWCRCFWKSAMSAWVRT